MPDLIRHAEKTDWIPAPAPEPDPGSECRMGVQYKYETANKRLHP
jgi:hypothetical protein